MKRFQFPLEKIRQYRKLQMDSEQARLEELLTRLRSLDHMEAELRRQRLHAERELLSPGAVIAGQELERLSDFRHYTDRVAAMIGERRARTRSEVAEQRQRLLEARQRYEMLARLKERSLEQWNHDFQHEQENLAAELYLARWKNAPLSGYLSVARQPAKAGPGGY